MISCNIWHLISSVASQRSSVGQAGSGALPYLLASFVLRMHCNACEQLCGFIDCAILSSRILTIFCSIMEVSQKFFFTAQKCSSYLMAKQLKKLVMCFLFQKTSVPNMLNISMLASGSEDRVISQISPKAGKTLDLSFQGKVLYSQRLRRKLYFVRNSCYGESILKKGIWQYSHHKFVTYKSFYRFLQKLESKIYIFKKEYYQ